MARGWPVPARPATNGARRARLTSIRTDIRCVVPGVPAGCGRRTPENGELCISDTPDAPVPKVLDLGDVIPYFSSDRSSRDSRTVVFILAAEPRQTIGFRSRHERRIGSSQPTAPRARHPHHRGYPRRSSSWGVLRCRAEGCGRIGCGCPDLSLLHPLDDGRVRQHEPQEHQHHHGRVHRWRLRLARVRRQRRLRSPVRAPARPACWTTSASTSRPIRLAQSFGGTYTLTVTSGGVVLASTSYTVASGLDCSGHSNAAAGHSGQLHLSDAAGSSAMPSRHLGRDLGQCARHVQPLTTRSSIASWTPEGEGTPQLAGSVPPPGPSGEVPEVPAAALLILTGGLGAGWFLLRRRTDDSSITTS